MKIKEKLIQWLGGIMPEEVPPLQKRTIEMVRTEKPIIPIAVSLKHYNFEPWPLIRKELPTSLGKAIDDAGLCTFATIPYDENMATTRATVKIIKP